MADGDFNFINEIKRDSLICGDVLLAKLLTDVAVHLREAVDDVFVEPSEANLRRLNGHWARAAALRSRAGSYARFKPRQEDVES